MLYAVFMQGRSQSTIGRQYFIEDVFKDFEEYQRYLTKALGMFQDNERNRNPSFKKFVPEYLEIEFHKSIKAPRLYFPRYKGIVVVQLPDTKIPPKKKALIRERYLERFVGIVKANELAVGEEIAIRMKILEVGKNVHAK